MLSAKGLVKHQTRCDPKQFHWARMVVQQWYGCTVGNDHNANFSPAASNLQMHTCTL